MKKRFTKLGVCVHLFYLEQWDEIKNLLHNLKDWDYELFVSLQTPNQAIEHDIEHFHAASRIFYVDNRGYDLGAFIYLLHQIQLEDYDLILKLHTKTKSGEMNVRGQKYVKSEWRHSLLYSLVGSKETVRQNIARFRENDHLGMIAPWEYVWNVKDWSNSYQWSQLNLESVKMFGKECEGDDFFVAGTMFWVRSKLLVPIRQRFSLEDFEETRAGIDDNTLAHTVERFLGICVLKQGFTIGGATPVTAKHSLQALPECPGDLHLLILQGKPERNQKRILRDLRFQKSLHIMECYHIEWSHKLAAENFARLRWSGTDKKTLQDKENKTELFLLVTLLDQSPHYETIQTSRGMEFINSRFFNLKKKYQMWSGGEHKVHGTNSHLETNHDITLLLGINYSDYLSEKELKEPWDGISFTHLTKDLVGNRRDGWRSFSEFFYTLNSTASYVVLGRRDMSNKGEYFSPHADIDILTSDYNNLALVINGKAELGQSRPHYRTRIGGNDYYLDIWNAENNFYDPQWSKDILCSRILSPMGYYEPEAKNLFFGFVYRCLITKNELTLQNRKTASRLYTSSGVGKAAEEESFTFFFSLLQRWMKTHGYRFIRPQDSAFVYNEKLLFIGAHISFLEAHGISNVSPYLLEHWGEGERYYYTGWKDEQRLFIKYGGDSAKNEYLFAIKLHSFNHKNFPNPVLFLEHEGKYFIIYEFFDGNDLQQLQSQHIKVSSEQKEAIVRQLEAIGQTLRRCGALHRDICPEKLLLSSDGTVKLIGAQWIVQASPLYKELPCVLAHPKALSKLGKSYHVSSYCWDDVYSLYLISRELNVESSYLKKHVGECRASLPALPFIEENERLQSILKDTRRLLLISEQTLREIRQNRNSCSPPLSQLPPFLTFSNCWRYIKWPKLIIQIVAIFIVKKTKRRCFRRKHSKP